MFDVLDYSIDDLKRLLGNKRCPAAAIDSKLHSIYFEDYFCESRGLGAKTIVVEPDYVDRDYLEDFAGYYVKCFDGYERRCTRLHFFRCSFTKEQFRAILRGEPNGCSAKDLQEGYLGFIVVKPLPKTVVGRTCLTTYGRDRPDGGTRHYQVVREYKVNLFGIELHVDTLAFQEQDSEVAACATSALWSAFHGTGFLFHHRILTPVEITKAATENESSNSRDFPASGGLSPEKMARAIRALELEPFLVDATDVVAVKSTAYAYLSAGVPVVLVAAVFQEEKVGDPLTFRAYHAVTIAGFGKGLQPPHPHGRTGVRLEATRIDRLYAHDDQIGPFARMEFDNAYENFELPGQAAQQLWSLKTSWPRDGKSLHQLGGRLVPAVMIVPLYHKIRIPYATVEDTVADIDGVLTTRGKPVLKGDRLVWDIHLAFGGDLKALIAGDGLLTGERRERFLARPLPRFVWRAAASLNGAPQFDLIFDATDIGQGKLLRDVLEHAPVLSLAARDAASASDVQSNARGTHAEHVWEWFRTNDAPFPLPPV
jgi:hypothetical protein